MGDNDESIAELNDLMGSLNNLLNIMLGILIFFLSFMALLIDINILETSFFGLNTLAWLILLNLMAIYLLLSGLKPKYKLANFLKRHELANKNITNGLVILLISLVPLAESIFLMETLTRRIFFALISIPGLTIAYINLRNISLDDFK